MPADVPSAAAGGLITTEEAAAVLGCKPRTARLLAQTGALPAVRIHNRLWLFELADVEAFASRREPNPAA